jgi:hypothetical protein
VRFFLESQFSNNRPVDYTWQVSSDGSSFSTAVTVTGNAATDRTDTFTAASTVTHLRLSVTATTASNRAVHIGTLEAIGAKITSTGTVTVTGQNYTRTISQTVVADDASPETEVAYDEPDWAEQ